MQSKHKTEQLILKKAEMLFSQHGWLNISVKDICHEVEISRVTYYQYFKNKNEILIRIFEYHYQDITAYHEKLLIQPISIEHIIESIFSYIEKASKSFFSPAILRDIDKNTDPELIVYFDQYRKKKYQFLNSFFLELQKQKIIHKTYPSILIHNFIRSMDDLMFSSIIQETYQTNKHQLREDILNLTMFGLRGNCNA